MPAWLNRALTNRILNSKIENLKKGEGSAKNKIIMRIGETIALPKDVDVYIFEDSDRASTFVAGFEYPEELDAAVEMGIAMKGNAENLLDSIPPKAFVWLASNM
jgi:hypothetical protein